MAVAPEYLQTETSIATADIGVLLRIAEVHSDAPSLLEEMIWRRLAAMRAGMIKLLSESGSNAFLKAILNAYMSLPANRQARVLLSSEFCECYGELDRLFLLNQRVAIDEPVVATFYSSLLDIIVREQSIDQLDAGVVSDHLKHTRSNIVWSPMGDVYAVRDGWGAWTIESQVMIGDVIAIDTDSPVARNFEAASGTLSYPALEFSFDERNRAVAKLQAAIGIIDELCPTYGIMIRNFVRRIILRKSLDENETVEAAKKGYSVTSSEHAPRQPGSIRILNPHLDECSVVLCVEKLLHESTHNVLAAWEMANGSFVENYAKYRPMSPWSGNQIPNSSFVHATFIYYMCHRLFVDFQKSLLATSSEFQKQICAKLATFAAGFLGERSIFEQLMLVETPQHDIRNVLERMQFEIRKYYGASAIYSEELL